MDASELFQLCGELAVSEPTSATARRLHEVLTLTCAEGCRHYGGAFGNLFSQVDFLCRKLGVSSAESRELQTARRHTNAGAVDAAQWPYDVRAVVRLVSAVFNVAVPQPLTSLLPAGERRHERGLRINKDYVRCIVSSVTPEYIYADTADGPVSVDYQDTTQGRDFAYLQKVVRQGMQLNLLDNHVTDGIIIPGIVIVEPDFLIDISSIASCFTAYGHHPLLYTLNRFCEHLNTQAALLGNFAGTALDELFSNPETPVAHVLQRSFHEQLLRFCACDDFNGQKFTEQAALQMENIRQAVVELRRDAISADDDVLLEPSFICERLGLQGRVDMMTAGMSLLVEQKSGRNMKIEYQSHDSHGVQLESHYVQLLLYYGVLRYNFGISERQCDTRLLYSRYPARQGLVAVNYYRTLLREALQLRNRIVATELLIARDGAGRILPLLNADTIYKGVAHDSHFHRYVLPEIATLSSQLSSLNPLERTYLERMLTFVYREQIASKVGSSESMLHHSSGSTADLWQMSLSDKLETGNIIMDLEITAHESDGAADSVVTLVAASPQPMSAALNFRDGDMVYLYSYDVEPDVRRSILYKGTLQSVSEDRITVVLTNSQHHTRVFSPAAGRRWAIEHGGSDIGAGSSIRALYRLMTSAAGRRSLLLGQRRPGSDSRLTLSRSYHPDYDDVLLKVKQARDYFLLVGPPGTGKTSMALRFIVQEELAANEAHGPNKPNRPNKPHEPNGANGPNEAHAPAVLLTAYTNRAVDEICAMLCSAAIPFLRIGKSASCAEPYRRFLVDNALAATTTMAEAQQAIDAVPVVVGTTATLQSQPFILQLKHFTLAIVDEASQILEPSVIGLLSSSSIDRFVLVGDHKQLPAVVQQDAELTLVTEQCLRDIGLEDCRQSLFERLLRCEHRHGSQFVGTLHTHGRMHPDVALFPLTHFYQREQLRPVPLPHQQETALGYATTVGDALGRLLSEHRMLFIANDGDEEREATIVADVLLRIRRMTAADFDADRTVGVIVPYRRQIMLIRHALEQQGGTDGAAMAATVTIDTVERYQGSQRDVIVYSFAVSRGYQLDFLTATTFADDDGTTIDRKLNVALTRARRQTIVVGRPDILRRNRLFSQLIDDCSSTKREK